MTSAGFAGRLRADQPFGLRDRARRRGHRHAARLRLLERRPSRRSRGPGRDRPQSPARRRSPGSTRRRPKTSAMPGRLRSARGQQPARPPDRARSTARASPAAPASSRSSMGQQIFAPRHLRASTTRAGSAACARARSTARACRPGPRAIIEDGVLTTWLLDSRSARQLGLQDDRPRRRAASAARPRPSPTNLYLAPGTLTPAGADGRHQGGALHHRDDGLERQRLTGDYSRGARRVHDPRRRAGRAGGGDHGRRVAAGDVPAPDARQRSALPPRHRRADGPGRGHDAGRGRNAGL